MTNAAASTAAPWRTSTTWRRWYRRLGALALVLMYVALIAASLNLWAQATPNWGLRLAAQGPQQICPYNNHCLNTWGIAHEEVGSISFALIPAHAQICGYITRSGQRVPIQRAYTSTDEIETASALILLSPQLTCEPEHAIANGQISPLAALVDFAIALIGATLAALLFLNASQRPQAIHTIAFLSGFILIFAWLPLRAIAPAPVIMAGTAVMLFLTPSLLATLLWHLLIVPNRRWQFLGRAAFFAAILGSGLLGALLLALALAEQHAGLYRASVAAGNAFIGLNVLIGIGTVVIGNFFRPSRTQRDFARILGVGTLIALGPWLLITMLPPQYLVIDSSTAAISLVAFPLALAFVVLKRDLLRADTAMRRSTEQGVRIILIAFVSVLLLSLAVETLGLPVAAAATAFAVMLLIGIISPLLQAGASVVTEAGLFPEMWRYHRVLNRAAVRPGTPEPQQIVTELLGEIRLALPVRDIACLVRDDDAGQFVAVADGFSNRADVLTFAVDEPVITRLQSKGQPLLRADFNGGDEDADSEERYGIWQCFVPIMLEDRLIGMITLGPRDDALGFSTADRRLLVQLANRRAVALDYGRVLAALRQAYEEQKYVDELKDQFIMTAHHELRTPLTTLLGYVEIVDKSGPDAWQESPDDMHSMVREAIRAGDDLTHLLDTLLTADRNMLKPQAAPPKQVDVSAILNRIVHDIQVGNAAGRQVMLNCPNGLQGWVDKDAFTQIITNLLTNAIKYSPAESPVEVRAQAGEPGMFQVSVRDWGGGIPIKDQAAIFERFVRLERDLNSPVRGTGLGLAIVKERVNAMGGLIWVESAGVPGEGSAFFVTLPTQPPAERPVLPPAHAPEVAPVPTPAPVPAAVAAPDRKKSGATPRQMVRFGPPSSDNK